MPPKKQAANTEEKPQETSGKTYDNSKWSIPSKRASSYAEERKKKAHKHGQKKGKPLTEYEAGMRSGYLQCQHDHASFFKYRRARSKGMSKKDAAEFAKRPLSPEEKEEIKKEARNG